ncbi:hypothetical protein BGZ80_007983 [Entomortierella chlamydospora]|uniref:Uncharacterized protein n=1 Tax=Entomortierella chlamydospora TaxID=101097 RepID=A0A9P6N4M6_9FUNG|nr:hypothetical protein BGZ80_007983 [Entomortierella chlamydospora]
MPWLGRSKIDVVPADDDSTGSKYFMDTELLKDQNNSALKAASDPRGSFEPKSFSSKAGTSKSYRSVMSRESFGQDASIHKKS